MSADRVPAGAWVEIEQVVLEPGERAPGIPEDTAAVPLLLRVAGFLTDDAVIGEHVRVRTLIGRELEGVLRVVGPHYTHSFGDVVPELLTIGTGFEGPDGTTGLPEVSR